MKQIVNRLSLILAALAPAMLGAQAMAPAPTYTVISVYRETVKPGKNVAHDLNEEAWARAVAGAKPPAGYLALSAMSGAPENWYISAFENWAALETANRATEASPALTAIGRRYSARESDFLSDGRAMLLTVREDLSFGRPADLAASRYFSVTRVTVRPGHTAEYEENRKMIRAAHERTGLSDGYSIWQAASGAPVGTYFVFVARKLLGEIDASTAPHTSPAYVAALGGPEGQKKMAANTAAAVVSSQVDLFAFAPQQSVPPPEWVTADPRFWKHKVPAPRKP